MLCFSLLFQKVQRKKERKVEEEERRPAAARRERRELGLEGEPVGEIDGGEELYVEAIVWFLGIEWTWSGSYRHDVKGRKITGDGPLLCRYGNRDGPEGFSHAY